MSEANDVMDIFQRKGERSETREDNTLACASSNQLSGRWSKEEHSQFVEACLLYGDNWKELSHHVKTRSISQIRSHSQKYIKKLLKNRKEVKKRARITISKLNDFPIKPQDIEKLAKEEKEDIIVWIFTSKKSRNKRAKHGCFSFNQHKFIFKTPSRNINSSDSLKDNSDESQFRRKLLHLSNIVLSDPFNSKREHEAQVLLVNQILQQKGFIIDYLLQQRLEEAQLKSDSVTK